MLQRLELPGADIALDRHWLPAAAADALFAALQATVAWEVHRLRLFGRSVESPRRSCWIGDRDAAYTYSGTRFQPRPWPSALLPIRRRLGEQLGIDFNSVLANLYRDGRDCMGWHSDSEAELGAQPPIASVSLGAARRFVLKAKSASSARAEDADPRRKLTLELPPGSLLLMRGETQRHYRHALPRTAKAVGPRINLTFRRILAG